MFSQIDAAGLQIASSSLTWDFIKRLRDVTKMKILIKGLESAQDAELAVRNGADGIVVSNHGGRATDTGRGTLECLPEIAAAIRGRVPIILDGGVRHRSPGVISDRSPDLLKFSTSLPSGIKLCSRRSMRCGH
jgi:isopentenyl diphosphate isomerase/L-lactate dehydrogenase-like FMN-dependent dehydrogenase